MIKVEEFDSENFDLGTFLEKLLPNKNLDEIRVNLEEIYIKLRDQALSYVRDSVNQFLEINLEQEPKPLESLLTDLHDQKDALEKEIEKLTSTIEQLENTYQKYHQNLIEKVISGDTL
ncbi:hypothetical protein RF11_14633 [Thelohanellus kitauei]|uniref:Uncharacterized protein n=1 Tax=Thelohanellus kitauei TaxID=669202 RepID=A0A0C2N2D5_THEKT|nr:hypothetical protein RF11_14633 [Thelohanellus kitauei]